MTGAHRTVAIAAALLTAAAAAGSGASAEGTSVHAGEVHLGATHKYTEHPKEKPTSGKALRADVRISILHVHSGWTHLRSVLATAARRLARLPSVVLLG